MTARYAIPDEPHPGAMERWIVDPVWPLFAQMLGGSWIALPWSVFNAFALGSATRRREVALAVASLVASAAWVAGLWVYAGSRPVDRTTVQLLLLPLLAIKLVAAYAIYLAQSRSFELWEHFGGRPRNGIIVVAASLFAEIALFEAIGWVPLQLVLE